MGPLVFTGWCLASVNTGGPHKERWSELTLYETEASHYVTVVVGKSRVPGEVDICSAMHWTSADKAIRSFVTPKTGRLSAPALELITRAASHNAAVKSALIQLQQPQRVQ